MVSLIFTDFETLNRDAEQLCKRVNACVPAMKKACGADHKLFDEAMRELKSGEFARRGGKLRMVAEEAGVLAQVAEMLPMVKSLELNESRRRVFSASAGFNITNVTENLDTAKRFLLEARLRKAIEDTQVTVEKDGSRKPVSFEEALSREEKRRASFLEAYTDMMKQNEPSRPFDARQLHVGAGLAHHRLLTNQAMVLPYAAEPGGLLDPDSDPWHLINLDTQLEGFSTAFGFTRKDMVSETKAHQKDAQKRDFWIPVISIDMKVYEPLMKIRDRGPKQRDVVDSTLGAIQKFTMISSHDYLHNAMYTVFSPERKRREADWTDLEGPDSTYRALGSPEKLFKQMEKYHELHEHFYTHNEHFSLVLHRQILNHLFNSETIDGQDNTRGRNMKAAVIAAGVKFAKDLGQLGPLLEKEGVPHEEAGRMVTFLATTGLSQLALAIDLDDKDMKKVYAAFEKNHIFKPYKLPAKSLLKKLYYYAGNYTDSPPHDAINREYLERKEPIAMYKYLVESLRKWGKDLPADAPLSQVTLKGEEGIKARLLTKPWGLVVGALNEPDLNRDFCSSFAHGYYDAFMEPAIVASKPFKTAAAGYNRLTGAGIDFDRR